jgi:hypothetical protein
MIQSKIWFESIKLSNKIAQPLILLIILLTNSQLHIVYFNFGQMKQPALDNRLSLFFQGQ